jgi:hypothetical protein
VENSVLSALVSFILSTDEIKSNPSVLGLSILILVNLNKIILVIMLFFCTYYLFAGQWSD